MADVTKLKKDLADKDQECRTAKKKIQQLQKDGETLQSHVCPIFLIWLLAHVKHSIPTQVKELEGVVEDLRKNRPLPPTTDTDENHVIPETSLR
jgi:hypothetical protein